MGAEVYKNSYDSLVPLTKVYVDLNAIAHNVSALKALCAPGTAMMAVVKANGYGHGSVAIARTALENGASFLGVARISEAVVLREASIDAPMLLFGDAHPSQIPWLSAHDVRVTVTSLENARLIAHTASGMGKKIKVHVKVDTGMGRFGFMSISSRLDQTIDEIMKIMELDAIFVEGIYTHFANADSKEITHAGVQIGRFNAILDELESRGKKPAISHAANSAATIGHPDSHFNMVRPGISIYGLWPSHDMKLNKVFLDRKDTVLNLDAADMGRNATALDFDAVDVEGGAAAFDPKSFYLEPAMSIVSKIIHLKSVPAGFEVSYGSTYVTSIPTKIATVPIGYADGYSRLLSSRGHMLVRGKRAFVAGRVCMDFTMIDVGHIPDVASGDEVVIMGKQDKEEISADEIASHTGTINYEVVASLTGRMPVKYLRGDSMVGNLSEPE
ncbi:Alanine racemase [Desulfamplus magnetovallimortis]|uniref:Alanine racemase n=1 Tax=Desulfamplus magnetovallimortis TaxID=1246637 RepID=A0A1W1H7I6_9BACT|nr:alanine racemase [Desulfamplus magnetovallimortis]SLM28345.1 Alanine racemase [Desulfamplus magnetovallimortis]